MGMIVNACFPSEKQSHWFLSEFQEVIAVLANQSEFFIDPIMIDVIENAGWPEIGVFPLHHFALIGTNRKT